MCYTDYINHCIRVRTHFYFSFSVLILYSDAKILNAWLEEQYCILVRRILVSLVL